MRRAALLLGALALAACARGASNGSTAPTSSLAVAATSTPTSATTTPPTQGRTTTSADDPNESLAFTNVAAVDVAAVVAAHCSMRPLLIPTAVPSGWLADVTTATTSMSIVYRSPDGTSRIGIAIVVPNPPAPTGNASQQFLGFRGDLNSLYQIDDTSNPTSSRELLWTEPGAPYPPVPGIQGVPYYVTSAGVTEAAFWNFARSLHTT